MSAALRITAATTHVLEALAAGCVHGFDILDFTGFASGTVYPILRRLDAEGLVKSRWEPAANAQQEHRPPRRNYELTAAGKRFLAEARLRYPRMARTSTTQPARS
jgi:PadR family transcriptional regulator, regulatory protein PadR